MYVNRIIEKESKLLELEEKDNTEIIEVKEDTTSKDSKIEKRKKTNKNT